MGRHKITSWDRLILSWLWTNMSDAWHRAYIRLLQYWHYWLKSYFSSGFPTPNSHCDWLAEANRSHPISHASERWDNLVRKSYRANKQRYDNVYSLPRGHGLPTQDSHCVVTGAWLGRTMCVSTHFDMLIIWMSQFYQVTLNWITE